MSWPELIVRGRRVVREGGTGPAAVHIRNGRIAAVSDFADIVPGCPVFDAGNSVVMPGLVDTHVHINEPGRTDWEGFESVTRAAAAGGVTTLIEMPLNSIPPTTTVEALKTKLDAARGKCHVDVGFWGGVVPGNTAELRPLLEAGVFGFKCFLTDSGVDEFPYVTETDLRAAMPELTAMGALLLAHAEAPGPIQNAAGKHGRASGYSTWLESRPPEAEYEAIGLLLCLSRKIGTRVHVVHLSSAGALPMIRSAKEGALPVTVETCPHYLTFAAEEIPDGRTDFKCAPPIRERENRERLWAGLSEGLIDLVASDHSPCPPGMKRREEGDFLKAWGGISSLELTLRVMWTQAQRRGYGIERLAEWLCRGPARLAGLHGRKGVLAPGCDADLVVWTTEHKEECAPHLLHHRHKLTPYAGLALDGAVEATFLRGRKVYERGQFPCGPVGEILRP